MYREKLRENATLKTVQFRILCPTNQSPTLRININIVLQVYIYVRLIVKYIM